MAAAPATVAAVPARVRPFVVVVAAWTLVALAALNLAGAWATVFLLEALVEVWRQESATFGPAFSAVFGALEDFVMIWLAAGAVFAVGWALLLAIAAAGVLRGAGWARIAGIVVGVLGLTSGLLGLATIALTPAEARSAHRLNSLLVWLPADGAAIGAVVLGAMGVAAYGLVLIAMIRNGMYFEVHRSGIQEGTSTPPGS